ncbi:ADP-ribosylation factor GTPase-activating protein AGD12-like isoform X2 [Wolffia australiana]
MYGLHDNEKASGAQMKLRDLIQKSDNRHCADCGAPDPKWASANIGVFICLKCCGIHRSLGSHISKVLSVTLDEWTEEEVEAMLEVGGNSFANAIYEAFIPEGLSKPGPGSSYEERVQFIRSKYEFQEFLKPSLRFVSSSPKESFQFSDSGKNLYDGLDSDTVKSTAGMVEFIGVLKVKVTRGTNLAVRDIRTSDPYVVLTLGQQSVKTSVMKSNLNPVWDEELQLSVPQDFGVLRLQVFDYDTFSADDIMGEAEVDLQPLITSTMAFGDPSSLADMRIGKWLKSEDNALVQDSNINIMDGSVRQDVSLKLQNVESGEIDLEMEWIPLDQ